jgi:hypothetical protein
LAIPLEGNSYAVDPALTGRRVELRYDPEDLSRIEVFLDGRPAGAAVPFVIGRHVHRAVAPPPPPAADPTGIDYLGLVAAAHDEEAGAGTAIDFTRLQLLPGGDAVARLDRVSSGLPRALNNAATAALIAAAAAGQDLIDDACAKKAVAELTRD